MTGGHSYGSPGAFRRALTDKLRVLAAASRWTLQQLQRQMAYDRLLERLYLVDEGWIVKGATALLARDIGVRGTLDIDLYREVAREIAVADLREAAALDLGDWFRFEIGPPRPLADTGGVRLPVKAFVGNTEWVAFHVDLVGEDLRMTGEPENVPPLARVVMPDVEQHGYRAYPLVDHVADKACAIFERHGAAGTPSTRYRDLVDLVAIVLAASVEAEPQLSALRSEAHRRGLQLPGHFAVPDRGLWQIASPLPSPGELVVKSLPEIRRLLNDRAVQLLEGPDGENAYEQFLLEYEEAVHRAWFIPSTPGHKELFGYRLGERVARGAFGQVYRSLDNQGREVAVKVLLEEIMHDSKLLASFRRGVQAMRILEQHHSEGMVTYERASEIPTFVVMEWIEGPNLADAKEAGLLNDWTEILLVSCELVTIIRRAHDLPERVLHRDVRPANIMLQSGWLNYADWQLVVLDFDLSTYRGARQKSVLAKESALGFLAPEQLEVEHSPYSTRNAAVDSFGVGMTLFFLCGGVEPEAYAQRRPDFERVVADAVSKPGNTSWLSLPRRFARVILAASRDQQPRRWDLAQILLELQRLQQVHLGSHDVIDTDLLCEEVAARCSAIATIYEWNADDDSVAVQRPSGLSLQMHGPRDENQITLIITWAATGVEERGSITKYLPERLQRCAGALRSGPWENVRSEQRKMDIVLTAVLTARVGRRRLDDAATSLSEAVEALRFS